MKKILCAAALGILLLSGCASSNRLSIQPIMDAKQSPATGSAYVAGMFSWDWEPGKMGFGLDIVNTATAERYVIPFGTETAMPSAAVDYFALVQLPPGEYRVENWLTYSSKKTELMSQTGFMPDSMAAQPFTLAPGEIAFIGSFVARNVQNRSSDDISPWSVRQQQLSLPSVQKALSKKYREFATLPLTCPSCLK